ncbi:hypothetical protein LLF85_07250 [bacterium]|nr:hypothetical protein [bacterium]
MNNRLVALSLIFLLVSQCFIFFDTAQSMLKKEPFEILKPLDENINSIASICKDPPLCPADFLCLDIIENYSYPSSIPQDTSIGIKTESGTVWHGCQVNVPTVGIFSDTRILCKVNQYITSECIKQRFEPQPGVSRCAASVNFLEWLQTRLILFPNALFDEGTIWKHYVNWLATEITKNSDLKVVKNSGKIEVTYEVWNLTQRNNKLPPTNEINNTECPGTSNEHGLIQRLTSKNEIMNLNLANLNPSGKGFKSYGVLAFRTRYTYSLQVRNNSGKYEEKCFCGMWATCDGANRPSLPACYGPPNFASLNPVGQPLSNMIITQPGTISARIRVSRPRSRTIPSSMGGACATDNPDGFAEANCVNPSVDSRYYIPAARVDPNGFYLSPTAPSEDDPYYNDVLYYHPDLKSSEKDIIIDPAIKNKGVVFIEYSAYADVFMRGANKCGGKCSDDADVPIPKDQLDKSEIARFQFKNYNVYNLMNPFNGVIQRNGVTVLIDSEKEYISFIHSPYKIKSTSRAAISGDFECYPRYCSPKNKGGDVYYPGQIIKGYRYYLNEYEKPFFDCGSFYVPLKPIAIGLGATMYYDVWDTNYFGEEVSNTMVSSVWRNNGKVAAIVYDQRIRVKNTGGQYLTPSPVPQHSYYLGLRLNTEYKEKKHGWYFMYDNKELPLSEGYMKNILIAPNFRLTHVACLHENGVSRSEICMCYAPFGGVPYMLQSVYDKRWGKESSTQIVGPYEVYSFRCPEYNGSLSTSDNYSMHMFGRAVDYGKMPERKGGFAVLCDCNFKNVLDVNPGVETENGLHIFHDKRENGLQYPLRIRHVDPYAHDACSNPTGSVSMNYHSFYATYPPDDPVPLPPARQKTSYIGPLVQIEATTSVSNNDWFHGNCYPPARCWWGDGTIYSGDFCPWEAIDENKK